jgi:hypothetical protein
MWSQATLAQKQLCCLASAANSEPDVEAGNNTGLFAPIEPPATTAGGEVITQMPVLSLINDDGELIELYYHDPITGAKIVTNSGNFEKRAEEVSRERQALVWTDTDDASADKGQLTPVMEVTVVTDGETTVEYYGQNADGTWDYSVQLDPAVDFVGLEKGVKRVEVGYAKFDVTTDTALPSIPAHATYAEIYLELSDSDSCGVQWRKHADAVIADGNANEEDKTGGTITLRDRDEIEAWMATSIDLDAKLDGSLVTKASVTFWNVDKDEDSAG